MNCCDEDIWLLLAFWQITLSPPPVLILTKGSKLRRYQLISDVSLLLSLLFVSSSSDRIVGLITLTLPACLSLTRLCPDSSLIPALPFKGSVFPSWLLELSLQSWWSSLTGFFLFLYEINLVLLNRRIDWLTCFFYPSTLGQGPDHTPRSAAPRWFNNQVSKFFSFFSYCAVMCVVVLSKCTAYVWNCLLDPCRGLWKNCQETEITFLLCSLNNRLMLKALSFTPRHIWVLTSR